MPQKQIVLRPRDVVQSKITPDALQKLITQRGTQWVVQQVAKGALQLSKAALNWWTSTSTPVVETITQVPAPANVGVALRGNAKLNGAIRIKHRELVGSVDGNANFNGRINPADANTFPYLSILARAYDKYKFHGISIYVVSSVPTSAGGRFYLAWDPDSSDATPAGFGAYMAMTHSISMSAWQSGVLNIPPSQEKLLEFFPDDLKDHGKFWFTSVATGTFDIFVEYDVTLSEPNLDMPVQALKSGFESLITNGSIPFGYGPEIAIPTPTVNTRQFYLSPGRYYISCNMRGASVSPSNWVIVDLGTLTSTILAQRAASSATEITRMLVVSVSSAGARVNISDVVVTPTSDRVHMVVSPISSGAAAVLADSLL